MNNFKETLKKKGTTKETAKKRKSGFIENVPENVKKAIEDYNSAMADKRIAEANLEINGGTIIEFARSHQDKEGLLGNYQKSYDIRGFSSEIKYVTSDRFKVDANDEETLKEMLGKDFNNLIEDYFKITVKQEVMENEELQKEFMKMVGNNLEKFFDIETGLKTTKGFDEKIYSVAKNKYELEEIRTMVVPYKPSLK